MNSLTWEFYDSAGNRMEIAFEDKFNNWKWKINKARCPSRLLNPTRARKGHVATLVILSVTKADDGIYGCTLVLPTGTSPISKVQLVVTGKFIDLIPFLCF
jgi:hypothetical protein